MRKSLPRRARSRQTIAMADTMMDGTEAMRLAQQGGAALQKGDVAEARDTLQRVVDAGHANPQILLMLGEAYRLAGDRAAQEKMADTLLEQDGNAIRALVWKGDCRRAAGERRAAASWYKNALYHADAVTLPPSLVPLIDDARAAAAELEVEFSVGVEQGLTARGLPPEARSPGFARALAVMRGEEHVDYELQRPSSFLFPGLPQRRFYEREEFDWAPAFEAATDAIRAELRTALADPDLFKPYLTHAPDRPRIEFNGMHDNASWSALHLVHNGTVIPELIARFPATFAALDAVPQCRISVRSPSILFSLLQPGAHIAPHYGMINARLICHLPLIVPGDGALTVGGEARQWEEGKLIIFDDSIEHEAINHADSDRVVLIFDIWRPELSEADRKGVAALFETVDAYR